MKIFELFNKSQDLSELNIHRLADIVEKAITDDKDTDFKVDTKFKNNDSRYDGFDTCTLTIDVVNTRNGKDEAGQNSTKALNKLIDAMFREFRAQGLTFTQPKGVGTAREDDRYSTGKIEFVIGRPSN